MTLPRGKDKRLRIKRCGTVASKESSKPWERRGKKGRGVPTTIIAKLVS